MQIEQDRQRAERNLADTEYLAREVVALRLAVRELASKDFIRAELRSLMEQADQRGPAQGQPEPRAPGQRQPGGRDRVRDRQGRPAVDN